MGMFFWVRWIVRNRWLVIFMIVLISALSALSLRRAVIATSFQRMLLGESPAYASYQARAEVFGGDELLVVSYADPEPLAAESVARLERAVSRLSEVDEIGSIRSLLDPIQIAEVDGVLHLDPYADLATASPDRRAALTAALEGDDTVRGLLRSDDRQHSALIVTLRPEAGRPSESGPLVMTETIRILEEEGFTALRRAGFLATVAGVLEETSRNLTRLFPLAFVAVVCSVYALFRRLLPVLVAATVSGLAVLWTMGFAVQLDPEVNIFSTVVPAVILVVAISDTIHLWSAYLIELSDGHSKAEAIERSAVDVGRACLLTSVTTFLGFISLTLIPTPLYRQVGLILGVGVGVALLITVTLMPALMSLLETPSPATSITRDRWSGWLAQVTSRWSWTIIGGFGIFTVIMMGGISQMRVDTDLMGRMSSDSALRLEETFIREHFSGNNLMEIFVDAPEGITADGMLSSVASFQDWLKAQPLVDTVYSAADLAGGVHRALTGADGMPESGEASAQYLLLVEMGDPDALGALVNFERTTLRLLARLNTGEFRSSHDLAQDVAEEAKARIHGAAEVEVTGLSVLFGGFLDELINGQRMGLLFSLLTIAAMMIIGLRSLRNGVVSMLPNLLPLLAVGGIASLIWEKVDSDLALVAMIAIGIGVDDTIHFLMRLRTEATRGSVQQAIQRTFRFAGRGILFTTIILTLGFGPMVLSDYFSIWLIGIFLPGALVVALLADLLLVPALASVGVFQFAASPESAQSMPSQRPPQ